MISDGEARLGDSNPVAAVRIGGCERLSELPSGSHMEGWCRRRGRHGPPSAGDAEHAHARGHVQAGVETSAHQAGGRSHSRRGAGGASRGDEGRPLGLPRRLRRERHGHPGVLAEVYPGGNARRARADPGRARDESRRNHHRRRHLRCELRGALRGGLHWLRLQIPSHIVLPFAEDRPSSFHSR